jgi:hypothetical protein
MTAKNNSGRSGGVGGWVALAAGAAAVVVAVIMVVNGGSDDSTAASGGESVSHVHGLGVDPADGAVHVATHNGLYELSEDGTAERLSKDRHDFMGFTVVDDDHFLASGHPSPGTEAARQLDRPLFGLIESTDGGATWTAKSLSGEVDFHALEAAHGQVYGFDATNSRFLVSSDGVDWETRSTTPIGDLAVDPDDPDRIVASSADGVIESADGGRSWTLVAGAPRVVFLDWHAERGLWGLDGQGQLHHLDGDTWHPREALEGSPQALLVHDTGVVAAVDDGSTVIYRSSDGHDWDVLYRDQPRA